MSVFSIYRKPNKTVIKWWVFNTIHLLSDMHMCVYNAYEVLRETFLSADDGEFRAQRPPSGDILDSGTPCI
jgi:hypothetical protein